MASSLGYDGGMTLAIQVADLGRGRAFYEGVLGFKHLYTVEEIAWAEFATEAGGVNVGLSQVEKPKVGAGPVPTFGVKDIAAARGKLEGAGVKFDGPTQEIPGLVKLATFFDPDGNALMLTESLQQG
ncbi:MAG: VOC family protein [Phycisphaerales bacterium]